MAIGLIKDCYNNQMQILTSQAAVYMDFIDKASNQIKQEFNQGMQQVMEPFYQIRRKCCHQRCDRKQAWNSIIIIQYHRFYWSYTYTIVWFVRTRTRSRGRRVRRAGRLWRWRGRGRRTARTQWLLEL